MTARQQIARLLPLVLLVVLVIAGLRGVAAVLLSDLHLHFFIKPRPLPKLPSKFRTGLHPAPKSGGSGSLHIPVGPILYTLLVIAIVAAVVVSIWWSTRLR